MSHHHDHHARHHVRRGDGAAGRGGGAAPAPKTQKLERALRDVNIEAVRIQYCSKLMRENFLTRDEVGVAARVWAHCFKYATPTQMLPLLYVASDVLQTSKHRADDFVQAFSRPLVDAFAAASAKLAGSRPSLARLWGVWAQRKVLPEPTLASMKVRADAEVARALAGGDPHHQQHPANSAAQKRKRPHSPRGAGAGGHAPRSPPTSPPTSPQQEKLNRMSSETRQRLVAAEISSALDPMKVGLQFLVDLENRVGTERGRLGKVREAAAYKLGAGGTAATAAATVAATTTAAVAAAARSSGAATGTATDTVAATVAGAGQPTTEAAGKTEEGKKEEAAKKEAAAKNGGAEGKGATSSATEAAAAAAAAAAVAADLAPRLKAVSLDGLRQLERETGKVQERFAAFAALLRELAAVQPLCTTHAANAAETQQTHEDGVRTRVAELEQIEKFLEELQQPQQQQQQPPGDDGDGTSKQGSDAPLVVRWVRRTVRQKDPVDSAAAAGVTSPLGAGGGGGGGSGAGGGAGMSMEDAEEIEKIKRSLTGANNDDDQVWDPLLRRYVPRSFGTTDDWRAT